MKSPNGKIGRLPAAIQNDVNLRLEAGWQGPELLAWLNSLPAVQEVLNQKFDGREIKHQNLTAWRNGGYREWKFRRDLYTAALDHQAARARQAHRIQQSSQQPQWPDFGNKECPQTVAMVDNTTAP